jgi:hypothetical protein
VALARDGYLQPPRYISPAFFPMYPLLLRSFYALSAGSLWAVKVRQNLLLACVLAGFPAATRNVGVFLVVPLIYEWIRTAD